LQATDTVYATNVSATSLVASGAVVKMAGLVEGDPSNPGQLYRDASGNVMVSVSP